MAASAVPSNIANFTDREKRVTQTAVKERWGQGAVELHAADMEIGLRPKAKSGTPDLALFWAANDCNFLIVKAGESRYRCPFFYNGLQQMGPDVTDYTELAECVMQLLQMQSDYARMTGRERASEAP